MKDERSVVSENPTGAAEKIEDKIDRLLSKYISVWVWSILFGTTIGLIYTFLNYRPSDRWGTLTLLLIILVVIGSVSAGMALICQLPYLTRIMIPTFFLGIVNSEEETTLQVRKLRKSVSFIILALILRLTMVLVELGFSSFRGF